MVFPGDSAVKYFPTMQETQETWVRSFWGEGPLEEGMATHSRLPGESHEQRLQSMELQSVRHDWATDTFTSVDVW